MCVYVHVFVYVYVCMYAYSYMYVCAYTQIRLRETHPELPSGMRQLFCFDFVRVHHHAACNFEYVRKQKYKGKVRHTEEEDD